RGCPRSTPRLRSECWPSDETAAEHQSQNRDYEHDQAEIATGVRTGEGADSDPDDCDRQDEPVAPSKKGYGGRKGQRQRNQPDEDRDDVQHVSYMARTPRLRKTRMESKLCVSRSGELSHWVTRWGES